MRAGELESAGAVKGGVIVWRLRLEMIGEVETDPLSIVNENRSTMRDAILLKVSE